MRRSGALEPLVFGGGTMLRLCHELPRYSVDMDFWFIKSLDEQAYARQIQKTLKNNYEITDAQLKHYTLVLEFRSPIYPRRLKIEIRRKIQDCDYQQKIAFSPFSTRQVVLKAHTLEQTMRNKVAAFLDRTEIRDGFDIEFLLRKGIGLPQMDTASAKKMQARLRRFKDRDFKVVLGSILEGDLRAYYTAHRFELLEEKLNE
jgi:predicted nucleotidyltransferase component of viral defense system